MKTKIWILLLLPLCLLMACDELGAGTEDFAELDDVLSHEAITKKPAIKVKALKFSPDYKRFVITTQMNDDIGPYSLTDSSDVKIDIEESTGGILKTKRTQPHLIKIRNLKGMATLSARPCWLPIMFLHNTSRGATMNMSTSIVLFLKRNRK